MGSLIGEGDGKCARVEARAGRAVVGHRGGEDDRWRDTSAPFEVGRVEPLASTDIAGYHSPVPDVLIRDVPAADLARIDARAGRLGLSRNEYLRRKMRQDASRPTEAVTTENLRLLAARFSDLADPEVMRGAWS